MTTPPEGFTYQTPMTIRYGDLDALGHVNNAKYLTYIEQARINFCRERNLWDGNPSALGIIVAKITMEYRLPLTMGDGTIDVWTRCSRIGTKSFDLESLVVRHDGQIAAAGVVVLVAYDYQTSSSIVVPEQWRQILTA